MLFSGYNLGFIIKQQPENNMLRNTILILTLLYFNLNYSQVSKKIDSTNLVIKKNDPVIVIHNSQASKKTPESNRETKPNTNNKSFDWNSICQDSISNLIGGVLFALLLFAINEYIFKTKNISGEWETNIKITQTTRSSFKDLGIQYRVHLLQLGSQVSGRGEKIKDINPDGSIFHVYPNVKRVDIEISGYYEKNFLKRSKLFLLIKENGTQRITSASYNLTLPYFKSNILTGTFTSTAADSRGNSTWTKII